MGFMDHGIKGKSAHRFIGCLGRVGSSCPARLEVKGSAIPVLVDRLKAVKLDTQPVESLDDSMSLGFKLPRAPSGPAIRSAKVSMTPIDCEQLAVDPSSTRLARRLK